MKVILFYFYVLFYHLLIYNIGNVLSFNMDRQNNNYKVKNFWREGKIWELL